MAYYTLEEYMKMKKSKKKESEDIAPVKRVDFLQKGSFEDGYQVGDVTKAILGTVGDAGVNIVKGVASLGEGVSDLTQYGFAELVEAFGDEEYAEKQREKAKKNVVENAFKGTDEYLNKYSLLGKTSDAILQGVGQVGGIVATGGILGALGAGGAVATAGTTALMGASSAGSSMSEAYQDGATKKDAWKYGISKGVIDAGTELLFGGLGKFVGAVGLSKGISSLDDVFARKLSSKISNQVAKNMVEFGVKASAEGFEEVLAGVGSAVTKKLTYMKDEELGKLIKDENLLEQFVVGTVTSGMIQSGYIPKTSKGSLKEANKTGRDFITGYNQSEQSVIDEEVKKRAEDKELSKKELGKLEEQVRIDLEKGRLDTDIIGRMFAKDSYDKYKEVADKEEADLKSPKEELNNLKSKLKDLKEEQKTLKDAPNTVGNSKKYDAIEKRIEETKNQIKETEKQIDEIKNNSGKLELQRQMDSEAFEKLKDTKLAESYHEKTRRGQNIEVDVESYQNERARRTAQNFKDFGANNSSDARDFLDFTTKLAEEGTHAYRFMTIKQLEESVENGNPYNIDVDADSVEAFVRGNSDEIIIIMDANKSLPSLVGHEVTHTLEKAQSYGVVQDLVIRVAKAKGEYDARWESIQKRYSKENGYTEEQQLQELTSDLIGDYLFSDTDFIMNLSTENPSVFKKVFDEIKHLWDLATAGSKQKRELERLKKEFENIWRENKGELSGETRYKLNIPEGHTVLSEYEKIWSNYKVPKEFRSAIIKEMDIVQEEEFEVAREEVFKEMNGKRMDGESLLYDSSVFSANHIFCYDNFSETDFRVTKIINIESDYTSRIDEVINESINRTDGNRLGNRNERFGNEQESYNNSSSHDGYSETGRGTVGVFEEGTTEERPSVVQKSEKNNRDYLAPTNEASSKDDVFFDGKNRYSLSSMGTTFFGDPDVKASDFMMVDKSQQPIYKSSEGYKNYVDQCLNNMRQTRVDFNEDEARKEIEHQIDGIVKVALASKQAGYDIYDDGKKRDVRDSKNRLLFSSLEPNSDYFTSSDISTICDKRKNFAEIYDDIVRAEEAKGVPNEKRFFSNVDNYFYLHKLMADKGLTQPCRQCYVESMRKNLSPMANAFLRLVNEADVNNKANDQLYQQKGKNKGDLKTSNASIRERVRELLEEYNGELTVETLTTEDGLAQLKIQAPLIYEAFNSFYGQSKPKMPKSATPFRFGELTALLTDDNGKINQRLVKRINDTGGFRLQSYSDFQIQNYTDVLQVIFEAGTMGLNGHAYTKVPAFLEATEGTNLKRNISIFMYKDGDEWKIDRNDSFPYSLEEIYDIVNADESGNTSIIAVSQNDEMSAWIMANDNVGYGIPFHKSGLKMGVVRDTIVKEDGREIKGYKNAKDHTKQQTEVWKSTARKEDGTIDHKALTKVKKGINIYEFWDFDNVDNLSKNELIEKNVKAYIDKCEELGYLPKFREYVMNNGKVLNNVLQYAKELGHISEDATVDDISFNYKGYQIPYGYYKFLGDFGMFKPDGSASPQKPLSLNDYNFDKAEEFFSNSAEVRRNEILQQFANGEERQKYRDSDMTAEELLEVVKQKRQEVVNEIAPTRNRIADDVIYKEYGRQIYGKDLMVDDTAIAPTVTKPNNAKPQAVNVNADDDEVAPTKENKVAKILTEEPEKETKKNRFVGQALELIADKGFVFENLAKKTRNRELEAKWNYIRYADSKAQDFIGNGAEGVKALNDIQQEVERAGITRQLYEYVHHMHNIDRMSIEEKAKGREAQILSENPMLAELMETKSIKEIEDALLEHSTQLTFDDVLKGNTDTKDKIFSDKKARRETAKDLREKLKEIASLKNAVNKPVFGEDVTAEESRKVVKQLEAKYPELKKYANEIYSVNNYLRGLLVEGGVISQETADLWAEMYPHYVPIRRAGEHEVKINVPLDSSRTGINAPIKRATGGSSDILPLFNTMAQRALQTYKAVAKNRFGVELKNTLGTVIGTETADVDSVIEGVAQNEELLQKGKNGRKPTFTVFEGGERVTFEIDETMYEALKPTSEVLSYTNGVANKISNIHRGVLTEYNPSFLARNIIKDVQDVLINSQHPAKTYANFPEAIKQIRNNGELYKEYVRNGGEQDTYFDRTSNTFEKEKSQFVKVMGIPFNAISKANNFIEKLPRLAEYIASRKAGRSIEVSMLDSARVTTNFNAGGDLTKFLNRNGATFLNASVQGAMQQVRNVREAKMNGLKGWVQLATKCAVAGLPVALLNGLLWDDDDEYNELSDYVKQNYYIVAKFGDGKFVRIPKGRTLAVIQNALEQTMNAITGNDEVDLMSFLDLSISNLAPNNPIENNIIAPIIQVKNNETWYGDDLVPTRLQDLPAEEQFDESTDSISKWIGEQTGFSPYKINYLLNQYSGAVGDTFLPMITPEAESGEDTKLGTFTAPIRDSFTTDSVLKNQNVSDFYDKKDEVNTNAKRTGATDEEILSNKYFNSINGEVSNLYAEKRKVQNSDMSDSQKYNRVREIQKEINALTEKALNEYDNVIVDGNYATVGDRQYKLTDDGWEKISDKDIVKQNEIVASLGITRNEYWSNKDTYDWIHDNPDKYAISKVFSSNSKLYRNYDKKFSEFKGDDKKEQIKEYIFGLNNLDYGQQAILYRSEYRSSKDKKEYDDDILEYLNRRPDLSSHEKNTILEALGIERW